jgi:hypothetical protein
MKEELRDFSFQRLFLSPFEAILLKCKDPVSNKRRRSTLSAYSHTLFTHSLAVQVIKELIVNCTHNIIQV